MAIRVPILAYHAIVEKDNALLPPPSSRMHAVSLQAFRAQLDVLATERWHTVLPEAIRAGTVPPKAVVVTFDDGHASDMLAAQELRRRGLQAVFFLNWMFLGTPGYLNCAQVRQLVRQGFRIGSHGMTHVRFAELSVEQLKRQLSGSKKQLEYLIQGPVTDLAVPFGSYSRRVVAHAVAADYRTIMTSDFGLARAGDYVLPRLGVNCRTTLKDFRVLLSSSNIGIVRRRLFNGLRRRAVNLPNSGAIRLGLTGGLAAWLGR